MFNCLDGNSYHSEEMFDILLELYNKIKDKFRFINKNNMETLTIDDSLDNVDLMMDSLNKLADMLEINPLFEEEYYLSLSIINDIEYIVIDNRKLLKENLIYIGNIVINFCRLICDKQDLLLSNKIIDYEKEYGEFIRFYNIQQEQFYNNLPEIGEDYEDAINKITNMLW
jgi:hypothetical protein